MNNLSVRILRYSFFVLFLWFGLQQITDPGTWISFLPNWTGYLPIPANMLIQINGWFEVVASVFLLTGVFTKFITAILSLHLLAIATEAGGAIGMRDLILAMMGLALTVSQPDPWTLDYQTTITK
jgi:uncharacterized membrane protein YphA (DoxX/SURF4 family)